MSTHRELITVQASSMELEEGTPLGLKLFQWRPKLSQPWLPTSLGSFCAPSGTSQTSSLGQWLEAQAGQLIRYEGGLATHRQLHNWSEAGPRLGSERDPPSR